MALLIPTNEHTHNRRQPARPGSNHAPHRVRVAAPLSPAQVQQVRLQAWIAKARFTTKAAKHAAATRALIMDRHAAAIVTSW